MPIIDFYEELAQTRCLSLNSEELRSKFQELSKKHHPDAGGHEERFTQINQAHQTLSNPASRIGHLYELVFEALLRSDGALSSNVMDLFSERVTPQGETVQTAQVQEIKTPPLPGTPMPNVKAAQANVNPITNLTATQEALLSPEEKIIASRT